MRGTRPPRIAEPSALMQALSICCWKLCCMPRRRWAPHVTHYTDSNRSCVHVCVHMHGGVLYLIRAYTTALLGGIIQFCQKNRSNQRHHQFWSPVRSSWFKVVYIQLNIRLGCSGLRTMYTFLVFLYLLFSACSICHRALLPLHNWCHALLLWYLRSRKSQWSWFCVICDFIGSVSLSEGRETESDRNGDDEERARKREH